MIEITNKFLLAGGTFMPELHLKQSGLTISACEPFPKHCERIPKLRETEAFNFLHRNELNKACFAHDAAYSDSKDLARRTVSDKNLKDRPYEIAKNRRLDGYQRPLASMIYKFFDKKTGSGVILEMNMSNCK